MRTGAWTRTAAAAALVLAGGVACGSADPRVSRCAKSDTDLVAERPVSVPYRGPDLDAATVIAGPETHLVFEVLSSEPTVERVRLSFAGETALDVDLPAGSGCGSGPAIFAVGYDVAPGPLEVTLDLQGKATTTTLDVPETGTMWAVVDVQSKREWGEITTYHEQPGWG